MPSAPISGLVAILSVWPLAALADLPAPIAVAIDTCLAEGVNLSDRTEILIAQGWQQLSPADRPAAALALAPYELIRVGQLSADDTLVRRAELLQQASAYLLLMINHEYALDVWLTLPDSGAFLNVRSHITSIVECNLSADLSPDLIAETIAGPMQVQELPPVTFTYIMTGEGRFDSPVLMTFAPDAFGALPMLPILSTPRAAANLTPPTGDTQ